MRVSLTKNVTGHLTKTGSGEEERSAKGGLFRAFCLKVKQLDLFAKSQTCGTALVMQTADRIAQCAAHCLRWRPIGARKNSETST
jgi:hypothetical protein